MKSNKLIAGLIAGVLLFAPATVIAQQDSATDEQVTETTKLEKARQALQERNAQVEQPLDEDRVSISDSRAERIARRCNAVVQRFGNYQQKTIDFKNNHVAIFDSVETKTEELNSLIDGVESLDASKLRAALEELKSLKSQLVTDFNTQQEFIAFVTGFDCDNGEMTDLYNLVQDNRSMHEVVKQQVQEIREFIRETVRVEAQAIKDSVSGDSDTGGEDGQ